MCGRYTIIRVNQVADIMHNITVKVDLSVEMARWNVAPSQNVLIMTQRDTPTLEKARWGLVPSWARDESVGCKMINARAETLQEKPAFRSAFKSRRCAVLADGFYEWRRNGNGSKTPMYIRLLTHELFAFAGLWENWTHPAGEILTSCTIITTCPNALMAPIHDRMPVIIPRDRINDWIGESARDHEAMLNPLAADLMEAHAVSTRVNSPKTDGPELVVPAEETRLLF